MHVVLHLTTGCNMLCKYCYSLPVERNDMTEEIAFKSIEYIAQNYPQNTGIIFFGGEPLLKKDLIIKSINYANELSKKHNLYFHYKVTTNGILLDEEFLKEAKHLNLQISQSIDGNKEAHNMFRKLQNGEPTWDNLQPKIDLLLKYQPYTKALMTVSPENLDYYCDSVDYIYKKGFRYLVVSLNYAADWNDDDIKRLAKQYKKIAKLYFEKTMNEDKFYFSPFDMKLATYIRKDELLCHHCHLGIKQISISHDGNIYPCVQFVQNGKSNQDYIIGDIINGIDTKKQNKLYTLSNLRNSECLKCDYNDRCNNKCSCLNWQLTKKVNELSPVICETERAIIPIVDELGENLFKKGSSMFIQKHYNSIYPILSMLEDGF